MSLTTYKPKVSIVMSFHKEPLQWIRFAVESMLGQTFRDFEFIIVCDNPEHTEGIAYIREHEDKRIRLMINDRNLGPTKSFNIAIGASVGQYIARMDADDISLPERLEKQVGYMDAHPETSVCATDVHVIDENGRIKRRNRYRRKHDQSLMLISNSIAHPSVMFRRRLLELRNPIYNEDFIYTQDYELWLFLYLKGHRFHTLDQALLLYRKSRKQISTAREHKQTSLFKKAHKEFIINRLHQLASPDSETPYDLKGLLDKAIQAYADPGRENKKDLTYIIYVLYFSLGTNDWTYRLRYLADRNLIALRVRFIFTWRLLFSKKSRRNRVSLD